MIIKRGIIMQTRTIYRIKRVIMFYNHRRIHKELEICFYSIALPGIIQLRRLPSIANRPRANTTLIANLRV